MYSLSRLLPRGSRRGSQALDRLAGAYERVLVTGDSTQADRDLVLGDLAAFSGFHDVLSPAASNDALRFHEGKRSVFGRVLSFLRMTPDQRRRLEEAAQEERATSQHEGDL